MNQKHILATVAALSLVSTSCIFVVHADGEGDGMGWTGLSVTKGSRVEATEPRTVAAFQSIEVSGSIDVEVEVMKDYSTPEVVVRADDNLIEMLQTESKDGRLIVRWKDTDRLCEPRVQPLVRVKVQSLERIALTGSGDASVRGLAGGTMRAELSGSGNVDLKGKVERVSVTVSGSGDVDAFGLEATEARVTCSGSGDVHVSVKDRIDAAVSGSGDVLYRGNPKEVERSIAGSGSVERDTGGP